ncbi:MAG: hypothetical protein ABID38_04335 [Candidatus Diapherotrites archaeon]
MKFRGQGTTEYLIILAVVIVIALVVVGVMGFLPGLGTSVTASQSKAYWGAASPLAITDWEFDNSASGCDLVMRNQTSGKITVTAVEIEGAALTVSSTALTAGQESALAITGGCQTCTAGNPYDFNVAITYDTTKLTGKTQTGTTSLVGTCA